MFLKVAKLEAEDKLTQLKLKAQIFLEEPITSEGEYKQKTRDYRNWQKLSETILEYIFSEHFEAYSELLIFAFSANDTNDWFYNARILREKVTNQASVIESIIQRLPYINHLENKKMEDRITKDRITEVFISHSSKDEEIVKKLVTCIELSLQIPDTSIRCTSLPGYQLEPGNKTTSEVLRENIESSKFIICLLTPSSQQSGYVTVELGAAWVLRKHLCILCAKGTSYFNAPGPLVEYDILKADNCNDVARLISAISKHTFHNQRSIEKVISASTDFSNFVASLNEDRK